MAIFFGDSPSTAHRTAHQFRPSKPGYDGFQSGSFASRVIPYGPNTAYPSQLFCLLRLRLLRLPLPLAERSFRCRRILDPLGDHRTACPRPGVPRSRGCALERAAARICREAGTRVTTNTLVIDFNIPNVNRVDNRRIEVIASGLPIPPSHTPLTFLGQLKTVKAHLETGQYKNSPSKTTTKCISQPICWLESRRLPKAVLFL